MVILDSLPRLKAGSHYFFPRSTLYSADGGAWILPTESPNFGGMPGRWQPGTCLSQSHSSSMYYVLFCCNLSQRKYHNQSNEFKATM